MSGKEGTRGGSLEQRLPLQQVSSNTFGDWSCNSDSSLSGGPKSLSARARQPHMCVPTAMLLFLRSMLSGSIWE